MKKKKSKEYPKHVKLIFKNTGVWCGDQIVDAEIGNKQSEVALREAVRQLRREL